VTAHATFTRIVASHASAPGSLLARGWLAAVSLWGCGNSPSPEYGVARSTLVYGVDGRSEYFERAEPAVRERLALSSVALVPNLWLDGASGELTAAAPTSRELDGVCPDERFGDQPSIAFCTGVLVDWDLVLTAGHCVRVLALDDF
jgi:hypothetical protein